MPRSARDRTGLRQNEDVPPIKIPRSTVDFTRPDIVKQFQLAAESFTLQATRSRKAATKILVPEGIYTVKGKLSKNYS